MAVKWQFESQNLDIFMELKEKENKYKQLNFLNIYKLKLHVASRCGGTEEGRDYIQVR